MAWQGTGGGDRGTKWAKINELGIYKKRRGMGDPICWLYFKYPSQDPDERGRDSKLNLMAKSSSGGWYGEMAEKTRGKEVRTGTVWLPARETRSWSLKYWAKKVSKVKTSNGNRASAKNKRERWKGIRFLRRIDFTAPLLARVGSGWRRHRHETTAAAQM